MEKAGNGNNNHKISQALVDIAIATAKELDEAWDSIGYSKEERERQLESKTRRRRRSSRSSGRGSSSGSSPPLSSCSTSSS